MEFVHRPFLPGETIAAISTPLGEGGISVVRISGKAAFEIAARLFSGPIKKYQSHTVHLGIVRDLEGRRIDEALALVMKGPRSFTGEDTVEFQCHGGLMSSKKILETAVMAGAKLAGPGEFALRAFLNGKIDLAKAEAIQKLIEAKNENAFELASRHLEGTFSEKIKELQKSLIHQAAIVEAWVDFPEEGIEFSTLDEIVAALKKVASQVHKIYTTFGDGQKIDHGISLCIVGPPNAGKSSLMNALLEKDRAIVTSIAGTTRDLLSENLAMGGLHFNLIDTAGIRETEEEIEREGIRRSKAAMQKADIILLVLDISKKVEPDLFAGLSEEKTLLVWNKTDLTKAIRQVPVWPNEIFISAKEKTGLDLLKERIQKMVWDKGPPAKDELVISSLRHKEALGRALDHLEKTIQGFEEGVSPEFLSADIRSALFELGTIIGSNITEDILSSIFSQFCVGK